MKKLLLILFSIGLLLVVGLQQRQVQIFRAERSTLRRAATLNPPSTDPGASRELEDEAAKLREENRDLLKLRNEAGQLRSRKAEFEAARSENIRLLALGQTTNGMARSYPQPIQVSTGNLSEQGLLTPEATIQTFARAFRDGDTNRMVACITPNRQEQFQSALQPWVLEERFRNRTAIELVARRTLSADTVQIGLETLQGTYSQKSAVTLKLVNGEWRLDLVDFPIGW